MPESYILVFNKDNIKIYKDIDTGKYYRAVTVCTKPGYYYTSVKEITKKLYESFAYPKKTVTRSIW